MCMMFACAPECFVLIWRLHTSDNFAKKKSRDNLKPPVLSCPQFCRMNLLSNFWFWKSWTFFSTRIFTFLWSKSIFCSAGGGGLLYLDNKNHGPYGGLYSDGRKVGGWLLMIVDRCVWVSFQWGMQRSPTNLHFFSSTIPVCFSPSLLAPIKPTLPNRNHRNLTWTDQSMDASQDCVLISQSRLWRYFCAFKKNWKRGYPNTFNKCFKL